MISSSFVGGANANFRSLNYDINVIYNEEVANRGNITLPISNELNSFSIFDCSIMERNVEMLNPEIHKSDIIYLDGNIVYYDDDSEKEKNIQIVRKGEIETVQASTGKQGFSRNTIIYKGEQQKVESGGEVQGTQIYGGIQFVFGEGNVGGQMTGSVANGTVIYGQGEEKGKQMVYEGGWYGIQE
nr:MULTISPECIES: hypothetical protein [unclassified Bartonella]